MFVRSIGMAFFLLFFFAQPPAHADCYDEAAALYPQVPITWLRSVARVESNFDQSAVNKNKNGSIDIGTMQINSYWRPYLGTERWQMVKDDACYNVVVGAWVLNQCIGRYGLTWQAVGCYNSPTRDNQLRYAAKVVPLINKLEKERWAEYRAAVKAAKEDRARGESRLSPQAAETVSDLEVQTSLPEAGFDTPR